MWPLPRHPPRALWWTASASLPPMSPSSQPLASKPCLHKCVPPHQQHLYKKDPKPTLLSLPQVGTMITAATATGGGGAASSPAAGGAGTGAGVGSGGAGINVRAAFICLSLLRELPHELDHGVDVSRARHQEVVRHFFVSHTLPLTSWEPHNNNR